MVEAESASESGEASEGQSEGNLGETDGENPEHDGNNPEQEDLEDLESRILKIASKKGKDTIDGAVAMIVLENHDTEVFFLLERKGKSYPIKEYRNKHSLYGGALKEDEKSIDGMARELYEEFEGFWARILIKNLLLTNSVYETITAKVNGNIAGTDIYVIRAASPIEVRVLKNARTRGDAGPLKTFTLQEVLKMSEDEFAFGFGYIIKQYIRQNYPTQYWSYINSLSYKKAA